jgi:hypothetical protein
MSPTVSFKTDVQPIFATSCAISSVCHGCDTSAVPGCTNPGYKPYLGTSISQGAPSSMQVMAISASAVGQPASAQVSVVDGSMVGNPSMNIVKAGDPANSFLLYKLDGAFSMPLSNGDVNCSTLACAANMSCGEAMPSGGPALPASARDTIRRWIAQGAQVTN